MSTSRYVTGLRAVEQLLAQPEPGVVKVYAEYQTSNPRLQAIIADVNARGIELQSANRARLHQIAGDVRHQGVVAEIRRSSVLDEAGLRTRVEQKLTDTDEKPLLLLILDGVQDPHNLGACLRTADAAGVDAVVVPRSGAAGLGPTVSKVAAGAAESMTFVPVANVGKTLAWLRDYGVQVIGTSDAATDSIFDCDLRGPSALLMGREHTGIRKHLIKQCDRLASLPMQGSVSSLNVSVATGICLFEVLRQRRATAG